ncbi:hypothetical protein OF83DRAFT_1133067 [Amylostereum chailletii]|nr:hypothetical protein OF83DRAFT_1133067 [Amylostereum chailletii]
MQMPPNIRRWTQGLEQSPLLSYSTFSDTSTPSFESVTDDDLSPLSASFPEAKSMSESSIFGKISRADASSKPAGPDDAVINRRRWFMPCDKRVSFLVEDTLYENIPTYFFTRDSPWFATRIAQALDAAAANTPKDQETSSSTGTIRLPPGWRFRRRAGELPYFPRVYLDGITVDEFEDFLKILFPPDFGADTLTEIEEWSAVLKLSTMWSWASIRTLSIRRLHHLLETLPFRRLLLARRYGVDHWVRLALVGLCSRKATLRADEIRQMDAEDIAFIIEVRESEPAIDLPLVGKTLTPASSCGPRTVSPCDDPKTTIETTDSESQIGCDLFTMPSNLGSQTPPRVKVPRSKSFDASRRFPLQSANTTPTSSQWPTSTSVLRRSTFPYASALRRESVTSPPRCEADAEDWSCMAVTVATSRSGSSVDLHDEAFVNSSHVVDGRKGGGHFLVG